MTTKQRRQASKRDGLEPGGTIDGEGRPIREYIGWDDAAGVFRQDDPDLRPKFRRRSRLNAVKPATAHP